MHLFSNNRLKNYGCDSTTNRSPEIPDSFRWFRRFFPDDGQKIPDGCSWNDTYE